MDVLVGSLDEGNLAWFENLDGLGTFEIHFISTADRFTAEVHANDLDADGDVDIIASVYVTSSDDKLVWHENENGRGNFGTARIMAQSETIGANWVHAADLDGDGDNDVLSSSRFDFSPVRKVAWYENLDGRGTIGPQETISAEFPGPNSLTAADVDGDGDLDVLASSITEIEDGYSGQVAWFENVDGQGTFGRPIIIFDGLAMYGVAALDIDQDGDLDVLSFQHQIYVFENLDGQGNFGRVRELGPSSYPYATSLEFADIDGDGDLDLPGTYSGKELVWFENTDGQGMFTSRHAIKSSVNLRNMWIRVADLDNDSDLDLVVSSYSVDGGSLEWYENTDGLGRFQLRSTLMESRDRNTDNISALSTGDVDGDGDIDVIAASNYIGRERETGIVWFENIDGLGTFAPLSMITTQAHQPRSLFAADMDGDGDADLLSASYRDGRIAWYQDRVTGDVNGDGVFDSSDLVAVFKSGQYEDGAFQNASYEDGDWNGDGEFDSKDLIAAFQAGTYVTTAQSVSIRLNIVAATIDLSNKQHGKPRRPDDADVKQLVAESKPHLLDFASVDSVFLSRYSRSKVNRSPLALSVAEIVRLSNSNSHEFCYGHFLPASP